MLENYLGEHLGYFVNMLIVLTVLFIGISFLVGVLTQLVKQETIKKVLAGNTKVSGNIKGAALGALTPFCPCTTLPVLVGMLKAKVPFGVNVSFLIASPLLNPITIGLLLVLFDLQLVLLYGAINFSAAVLVGIVWEKMGLSSEVKNVKIVGESKCEKDEDHHSGENGSSFKSMIAHALLDSSNLFRQTLPYLFLGAGIGALIRGYVPEDFIVRFAGPENPLSIPIAALIGAPMHIRASTLIPISAVLLERGMGSGAIVALLIGGTGASLPQIAILGTIFKKKLLVVFVLTILFLASTAGFLFAVLISWF